MSLQKEHKQFLLREFLINSNYTLVWQLLNKEFGTDFSAKQVRTYLSGSSAIKLLAQAKKNIVDTMEGRQLGKRQDKLKDKMCCTKKETARNNGIKATHISANFIDRFAPSMALAGKSAKLLNDVLETIEQEADLIDYAEFFHKVHKDNMAQQLTYQMHKEKMEFDLMKYQAEQDEKKKVSQSAQIVILNDYDQEEHKEAITDEQLDNDIQIDIE